MNVVWYDLVEAGDEALIYHVSQENPIPCIQHHQTLVLSKFNMTQLKGGSVAIRQMTRACMAVNCLD
eukprot:11189069-Ditylum_brightwellii.AAC.1